MERAGALQARFDVGREPGAIADQHGDDNRRRLAVAAADADVTVRRVRRARTAAASRQSPARSPR